MGLIEKKKGLGEEWQSESVVGGIAQYITSACLIVPFNLYIHPHMDAEDQMFPQPWAAMEDGYYVPCACASSPLATVSMLIYVIVAFITMFNEC